MHKIIIVEGHDNIGKTTLLKQTLNKLCLFHSNIALEHLSAPISTTPKAQKEEQRLVAFNWLSNIHWADQNMDTPLVRLCDRSIFGEFVYSQFRHYKPDYLGDICNSISQLKRTKILFLVVYSDAETFKKFRMLGTKVDLNTKEHEKIEKAELVSSSFVKLTIPLQRTNNIETEIVNTNMFDTLEDREHYIMDIFKDFLKDDNS